MTTEFELERRDGVLIMTINRPAAKNAMTLAISKEIADALDAFETDASLRVAILTGAGGTFCAGMDLKGFLRGERPSIEGRGFGGLTEKPPAKPLIAAVEGYALAGGFELALACDLIVAARDAKFGLPEVKRSLVATGGGVLRLAHRLPYHIAMEYVLTGDMMTADEARGFGLINRVTAPGEALKEALALAARIMANGPLAVNASKRIVVESPEWPAGERFARQREATKEVFASSDAREGSLAFAEKRAPVWQGK